MIYDTFPFFNELAVLQMRLDILDKVVDKFVLVEASQTQTRKPKPFYFEENKHLFEKYLDRIIHVKVTDCPTEADGAWAMENHQRNCIKRGLVDLSDDDVVLISDVDEIPNPDLVKHLDDVFRLGNEKVVAFNMLFHAYFINLFSPGKDWIGTTACRFSTLQSLSPQDLRNQKDHVMRLENGGNHFSWLGGWEKVREKALSCIEPLDKSCVPSIEEMQRLFLEKVSAVDSFIFFDQPGNRSVPLRLFSVDNLPEAVQDNVAKYPHLFV